MSSEENKRSTNRSRTPHSKQFLDYISSGWQETSEATVEQHEVASYAASRRAKVAQKFSGKLLKIEAGAPKTRSNDTEYRYRPHSAFAHLTGWGSQTVPDSVLIIDSRYGKKEILFLRPTAGKESDEFFANPAIGEFWVGQRPTLKQVSDLLGIETRDLATLDAYLGSDKPITLSDPGLEEFVSELRLIKDDFEIAELRKAVDSSIRGFEDIVRALPGAIGREKR